MWKIPNTQLSGFTFPHSMSCLTSGNTSYKLHKIGVCPPLGTTKSLFSLVLKLSVYEYKSFTNITNMFLLTRSFLSYPSFKKYFIIFNGGGECACVQTSEEARRKVLSLLELELQMAVGHHVGAGNHTPALCKNSKHSNLQNWLFSPLSYTSCCCYLSGSGCQVSVDRLKLDR